MAGWNTPLSGSGRAGVMPVVKLGRCWVLRRYLLPVCAGVVVGVLSGRSWSGLSNALVCGCGGGCGVGVWLCVECCIVDASILLWL